jgi:GNAT superfamily N-acetyltransferase
MTTADVPFGMHLSGQAGWTQRPEDWLRLLDLEPDGCFLAEVAGRPAGTTATCALGTVAWVALVLVEESCRGQGVGTALVRHALSHLDARGVRTVRLDATPLGRPLYEKLGFRPDYELARYQGVLPRTPCVAVLPRLSLAHLPLLAELDLEVTGTDRRRILGRLLAEWPRAVRLAVHEGQVHGYLMARPGARSIQIGPCVARPMAGPLLLADAWHRFGGRAVHLDIPTANTSAAGMAETVGLRASRQLLRMSRGEPVAEDVQGMWAGSGPEKG